MDEGSLFVLLSCEFQMSSQIIGNLIHLLLSRLANFIIRRGNGDFEHGLPLKSYNPESNDLHPDFSQELFTQTSIWLCVSWITSDEKLSDINCLIKILSHMSSTLIKPNTECIGCQIFMCFGVYVRRSFKQKVIYTPT